MTKPAPWTTAFPAQRAPKTKREWTRSVRAVSKKQRRQLMIYAHLRREYLKTHKRCSVYPHLRATEVHHVRGRTGGLLLDPRYWLAVSSAGHRLIHSNPDMARNRGWLCAKGEWGKVDRKTD
jgi:hypothetical protein